MKASEVRARIQQFLAEGRPGQIVLNSPGGGVISSVEIHERLVMSRAEMDEDLLDSLASPGVASR